MPVAHRIDSNQAEIVRKIRSYPGLSWTPLPPSSRLGDGLLRSQWWPPGVVVMCEVKPEKGKVKPHQEKLLTSGHTVLVRSFDDIEKILDVVGKRLDKINLKFGNSYLPEGGTDA